MTFRKGMRESNCFRFRQSHNIHKRRTIGIAIVHQNKIIQYAHCIIPPNSDSLPGVRYTKVSAARKIKALPDVVSGRMFVYWKNAQNLI